MERASSNSELRARKGYLGIVQAILPISNQNRRFSRNRGEGAATGPQGERGEKGDRGKPGRRVSVAHRNHKAWLACLIPSILHAFPHSRAYQIIS